MNGKLNCLIWYHIRARFGVQFSDTPNILIISFERILVIYYECKGTPEMCASDPLFDAIYGIYSALLDPIYGMYISYSLPKKEFILLI